ncbi:MAG: DUF1801 domain-containing protein [Methanobacterium sp.]|nr:DUF1801 domain-containing protein [Methanobacterium sp.]
MEKNREKIETFEDYSKNYSPEIRKRLDQIQETIKNAVPGAEEKISYKMPSFRFHGILLYYGAFKNHIGFYPASRAVFVRFKDELKYYKQSGKRPIQFPHDKPLPIRLIKRIAQFRAKENTEKIKGI